MKEFKIKLSSNVDELMAQFTAGSKELKEFAKNVNTAQNEVEKLGALKETITYISQMDKALSKLKKNQPDIFKQVFGNVDKQMKEAMQPLMTMPKEIGSLITKIGNQLDGIRSGKIEATNSELKALGEQFRGVAKTLGMEVNLGFLDGTSKAKVKADKLIASMEQLAKAYYKVHKAEVNTGLTLTVPDEPKKKRTKKSSGSEVVSSGETSALVNDGDIKKAETLTNSYAKLKKEIEDIKNGKDINDIISAFKIAEDEIGKLESILYNVDEPLGDTMAKMKEFLGAKFPEMSLKDIESSIQRFLDIQKELDNVKTDEEFARLDDEANNIRDSFEKLSVESSKIFDNLMDGLSKDDAVKQLADLLGIEVVKSAQLAGDATAGIENSLKDSGQAAEDTTSKVKVLEDAINEVIRNASKHKLEFSVVLNGEDVTVRKGLNATSTNIVENAGNMMSSLGKYFINSHTHGITSKITNDADLNLFARLKKYGVTNHNAIIGKDGATAFDLSNVSDSDIDLVIKKVQELSESGNVAVDKLAEIFKTINSDYTDVVKRFDTDHIGKFAQYINDVTKNAQASVDPLQQFKAIINELTNGKVNWDKHANLLEGFKPENAKEIFDKILKTKDKDGNFDVYDFSKKSMADVVSELASANTAGQQLVQTLTNVGQAADGTSASINNLGDEVDEALAQETGNLESKLERLRDLAEEYGMQITQRDRNSLESLTDQDNEKELTGAKADRFYELQEKVDAADESLMAFGEQYDKIILKLENGKKVEILPDDKGLRDLYKFMDEGDGRAFNGIDVSDIEFVRKAIEGANAAGQQLDTTLGDMRQAGEAAGQGTGASIDELNAKIEKEKQLTQEVVELQRQLESVPANPVDASELESAQREIKNLREEALRLEGALDGWKSSYYDAQNALDNSIPASEVENMVPNDVIDEYRNKVTQLTDESTQLKEILAETQSLLMETQKDLESIDKGGVGDSFGAESDVVKTNIQAEIDQLKRLKDKIFDVKYAVEQKIQAFVNERKAVDSNVGAEIEKLESLRKQLEDISTLVNSIKKIKVVVDTKSSDKKSSKPLEGEPLKGEQIGMDLGKAAQNANELAAAEQKVEAAVKETNDALDKQSKKAKEASNALDLAEQVGTLNFLAGEAKKAAGALSKTSSWSDTDKEHYEQLIAIIGTYRKSKEKITDEELADIRKIVDGYKMQADAVRQAGEETKKAANVFGLKELKSASDRSINLNALTNGFNSKVITDGLENARQAYQRLVEYQQKFNDGHTATDKEKEAYKVLTNQYNAAAKAVEDLIKKSQKMANDSRWSVDIDPSDLDNLEQSMQKAIQASENGRVKFGQFNAETGQLEYSVRRANGTWDHFTAQVDEAGMAVVGLNGKVKTTNGIIREFTTGVATKFKNAMQVFSGYDLFFEGIAQVKQGVQYVRDIDLALTELKKVTNETDEAYAQFLQTASQTARVVGSTVKDITTMTAEWSRLGYSMAQASELARSTAVLLNVSEFTDATDASEALISSIQAYGYAADESMNVVDVLNEVGNNFAVSSDGLATALQTSASALMSAGNDLNKSVALVAAANKVLQDPSQVGAALRTIALRIRGTSLDVLEEMGEETDGVIESVSKLQEKVKAISGVDILDNTGAYKDTYTILKELAEVWDDIGRTDPKGQAALLELLAGKNRSNALAAILGNLEDLDGAYKSALQAEGSAQKELDTYSNSIQGRINQFTNSVQTMWMNAIDTDVVKSFVNLGTALINIFDQINKNNPLGIFGGLAVIGGTLHAAYKGLPQLFSTGISSLVKYAAGIDGVKLATDGLTKSQYATQLATTILNDTQKNAALTALFGANADDKATVTTNLKTKAEIKAALAATGLQGKELDLVVSAVMAATGTNTLSGALGLLVKNIGAVTLAILKSPIFWVGAAIVTTIALVDHFTLSFKEASEQLKKTSEELDGVKSEIESLNNEIKTTSDRIDELNAKDKLTIVEQEELDALNAQNDELKAQKDLLEQREEILKRQQAKDALATYERDQSFKSGSYNEYDENGVATGNVIEYDPAVDRLIKTRKENIEGLEKANEKAKKAQEELLNAQNNGTETTSKWRDFFGIKSDEQKAVDDANKEVEAYQAAIDSTEAELVDLLKEREELYGDVGFFYGDNLTEDQKKWNEALTKIRADAHKTYIELDNTGKAISNAFSEISSRQFFTDELKAIQNEVGITGEDLLEMYNKAADADVEPEGLKAWVQSLIEAGVIADDSAESMQKIVDLSILISKGSTDAEKANKKLARSQKMLEYYKLYKQLNQYTQAIRRNEKVDKDQINTILNKMQALEAEISAYDILGDQIEEAKAAFDAFEEAQTADSGSDRLESASDMFKAIIDGFHSAELGSETFKAALAGLVPRSVYEDFDTLEAKYDAIWNYVNQDLNRYFTLEFDDDGLLSSVETTTADIERFFEDVEKQELGSFADGVWTINESDFSEFAEKMNMTESMLYALGVQIDKVNAERGLGSTSSFFDGFDEDAETTIYKTTTQLKNLDEQLINGEIHISEYAKQYNILQDTLKQAGADALDEAVAYQEASNKVDELRIQVEEANKEVEKLRLDPNALDAQIDAAAAKAQVLAEELGNAVLELSELNNPGELAITTALEYLNTQMEETQAKWLAQGITIPLILETGEVNDKLITKDLETDKYTVAVTPEVQGLSEESKKILEDYAEYLNANAIMSVSVEGEEDAEKELEGVKNAADLVAQAIAEIPSPNVDTRRAIIAVNLLYEAIKQIKDKTVTITTIHEDVYTSSDGSSSVSGTAHSSGTAHAEGDWGLSKNEKNALVGELGRETVVDPHTGHYYTVGDNGAELVDLPKDAIIFNHRQTEELFKNGHINSRGKAYVNGKAYAGTSGTIFDKYKNEKVYGSTGSGIEGVASAISGVDDDFEELFDWFEILVEEMEKQISLMEAQLENSVGINSKKSIYSSLIDAEYTKMDTFTKGIALYTEQANKFLAQIPAKYKELTKDGGIQITKFAGEANEKVVEAINNYREWADKAADLNLQLEETKARISELRVETQNMISTEYENKIGLITHLNDALEAEMDLLEERGERVSANFYEEMIKNSNSQLEQLQEQRKAMQAELDSAVKSGDVAKYSDNWYEMVNAIYDVDEAVIDCRTSIEEFNNSIQELHWDNFEKIIDAISAVSDEAEQLRDLIDDTDITEASDPKQWSKDGVTALGLVAQQMENAQYRAKLYAAEIEYLNAEFKKGNYSQDEYNEKLKELKDNQWDAIDAYESAKDAIIDLNKTRVDAIKNGIQKEIDAYEELINKRKEDLDAQKD